MFVDLDWLLNASSPLSASAELLVLLYINDVVEIFGHGLSTKLYADDVKIYTELGNASDSSNIQQGLDTLSKWCSDWQMKLSVHKCFVMHLRNDCFSTTYSIDNFVLPATSVANDLGVSIDAKLRFSAHYSQIAKKASQRAYLIIRCFEMFIYYLRTPVYCSRLSSLTWGQFWNTVLLYGRQFTKQISNYCNRFREALLGNLPVCAWGRTKKDFVSLVPGYFSGFGTWGGVNQSLGGPFPSPLPPPFPFPSLPLSPSLLLP